MALDLEELPRLFTGSWLWSVERPNAYSFRRADYLGPTELSLAEAARERVESELGHRPTGRVLLVTHLRTFGFVSNPVSFYFCHDRDERLVAIVAEITNTPWGERHAYVLEARGRSALEWCFDKEFHVSPFHGMEQGYRWRLEGPGEELRVSMQNVEAGRVVFEAQLHCERKELSPAALRRVAWRHPWMTLRVHLAIYWQAARLWAKRTPFYTHPDKRTRPEGATSS